MLRLSLLTTLLAFTLPVSAQTCSNSIAALTPTSQFTINGDGTVTDTKSNLMWKQCIEGVSGSDCTTGIVNFSTWQAALQIPEVLNAGAGFADHNDWRLPNIKELRSIVELQCYQPAVNLSVFPNMTGDHVWTSTPFALNTGDQDAWAINFDSGTSTTPFRNTLEGLSGLRVLLVRDSS